MKKHIFQWMIALMVLLSCLLISVSAVEQKSTEEVVASGSCGANLVYTLYGDGELVVSGTGAMTQFYSERYQPWYSYADDIKSVAISDGVTSISDYAFYNCNNLVFVTIGIDVDTIGQYAFAGCDNLYEVELLGTTKPDMHIKAFANLTSLYKKVLLVFPEGYPVPDSGLFSNQNVYVANRVLSTEGVPGVTGNCGAEGANVSWTLYESGDLVISGQGATATCVPKVRQGNVKAIRVEDGVTAIGEYAFSGCSKVSTAVIEESVTTIERLAFNLCENLTSVVFRGNVPDDVGNDIFASANDNLTVYYHAGTTGWPTTGTWQNLPLAEEPHVEVAIPAITPTCGDTGLTEGIYCSICEEVLLAQTEVPALDHDYIDHEGQEPTVSAVGWKAYQTCSRCDYTTYEEIPALVIPDDPITDTGRSISLGDQIYINQYITVSGFEGIDVAAKGGLLIWNSPVSEEEALYGTADTTQTGLIAHNGEYTQRTLGISAKNYADELYLRVYVEVAEGVYEYGPLVEYSVQDYCEHKIATDGYSAELKKTCAALLHYGAMAQRYFNYNTADLANANILEVYPAPTWMTEE